MKTAIYIDQKLFDQAEEFSYVAEISRSKLYCTAISEYLKNHSPDNITERLNSYYANHKAKPDEEDW
jgi:hypothetical protein